MTLYWIGNFVSVAALIGLWFVGGIPAMVIGGVWAVCAYFEGVMLRKRSSE
jgi:hypothetical protein